MYSRTWLIMSTNLFELPAIYLPGVDNLVADALPRWDESTVYIPSTPLLRILYDEVCIGDDIFGFLTIYDITVLLCFVLRFFSVYMIYTWDWIPAWTPSPSFLHSGCPAFRRLLRQAHESLCS